ncbi:serine protein kinase RIO [Actinoalloteichus sp. GBA129-24]|uniref:serine protein kinase RIO n=1 Tax=Actinoalloteichus sp. GBA129-24 TaxID=1612551 RepID=UPI001E59A371|nr:RIO1 family regulatory kinase/ATPase [Actinoalloteichus sp. GBA129-24]
MAAESARSVPPDAVPADAAEHASDHATPLGVSWDGEYGDEDDVEGRYGGFTDFTDFSDEQPNAEDDEYDEYADYDDADHAWAGRGRRPRRRARDQDEAGLSHRRGRLTEAARQRALELREENVDPTDVPLPADADRWTTWDDGVRGPLPHPGWLVTASAASDRELGVLKTGKEAEVHLIERSESITGASCLLAAKRYRSAEHRLFHRDAGYLEGRRMRRSREMRAIEGRTDFGRNLIAEQWATAEFAALSRLWELGVPVPYPAQQVGTELLIEFLGEPDGTAAPRLAQLRPAEDELVRLWASLLRSLHLMASHGLAHGDLSAYNLLVHQGELILIDLPQLVDVVANPEGPRFLARDVANVSAWFLAHGLPAELAHESELTRELLDAAGLSTPR